jgi:FAD/FMN-containing dehydrogenase
MLSTPLSGWGRTPVVRALVQRPEKFSALGPLVREATPLIARGLGRSYGDAALGSGGRTVLTERLNRLLDFDPETGILRAEAGVSLEDLLAVFVPRGWFVPVTPGTRFVTLGGAVASDVHGKNHHRDGSFGAHLRSLTLVTATGETVVLTPADDLFWATVGGMGLTGIIAEVELALEPIETACIRQRTIKAADLDGAMALFAEHEPHHRYSVAWIDCLAAGRHLGRGVLMFGDHASRADLSGTQQGDPLRVPARGRWQVPFDLPSGLLNRFTAGAFNGFYYHRRFARETHTLTSIDRFFYPLDGIGSWNRLYGTRGFVQYQCVVPPETSRPALVALLERCQRAGRGSFLAVLKRFGPGGQGWLSFPMAGYTLALDLPAAPGITDFLAELDRIVVEAGGRVYLAKDACLSPETFRAMYPRWRRWLVLKSQIDPHNQFRSRLSERLRLLPTSQPVTHQGV